MSLEAQFNVDRQRLNTELKREYDQQLRDRMEEWKERERELKVSACDDYAEGLC